MEVFLPCTDFCRIFRSQILPGVCQNLFLHILPLLSIARLAECRIEVWKPLDLAFLWLPPPFRTSSELEEAELRFAFFVGIAIRLHPDWSPVSAAPADEEAIASEDDCHDVVVQVKMVGETKRGISCNVVEVMPLKLVCCTYWIATSWRTSY